jgi:hypothetical protein
MVKYLKMKREMIMTESEMKTLLPFLDEQGRLTQYPTKRAKQLLALAYLAEKFSTDEVLTEKEVNAKLNAWHTFEDWALLRRDLCDGGFLRREGVKASYWKERKD